MRGFEAMHVVNASELEADEGSRSVSLEGAEVGPGDVVVVPAGVPHRFVSTGEVPLRQLSLHLAPEMLTEWLES